MLPPKMSERGYQTMRESVTYARSSKWLTILREMEREERRPSAPAAVTPIVT